MVFALHGGFDLLYPGKCVVELTMIVNLPFKLVLLHISTFYLRP